jgi:DNA adenine methylase
MNPLVKWPGGKSGEISKIEPYIPPHKRYVEPFFGGGALFFHLNPHKAIVNDISQSLIEYYDLIKKQDKNLYDLLICYNSSFINLMQVCSNKYHDLYEIFDLYRDGKVDKFETVLKVNNFVEYNFDEIRQGFTEKLVLDEDKFKKNINKMVVDKIRRTVKNDEKSSFSENDLKSNIITGFTSGYYMYFRDVYNDINLKRIVSPSIQYKVANFYFIREYCYGSMFRYNASGEFNIPYGGVSYNKKNLQAKIDNMFNKDVKSIFANTEIHCMDFQELFDTMELNETDFVFLDPPYDTNFSNYDGRDFTNNDQIRLAETLKTTSAKFILVIKNTDFIYNLYKNNFNILAFDNKYTYNMRGRNEQKVEHLMITNLPI